MPPKQETATIPAIPGVLRQFARLEASTRDLPVGLEAQIAGIMLNANDQREYGRDSHLTSESESHTAHEALPQPSLWRWILYGRGGAHARLTSRDALPISESGSLGTSESSTRPNRWRWIVYGSTGAHARPVGIFDEDASECYTSGMDQLENVSDDIAEQQDSLIGLQLRTVVWQILLLVCLCLVWRWEKQGTLCSRMDGNWAQFGNVMLPTLVLTWIVGLRKIVIDLVCPPKRCVRPMVLRAFEGNVLGCCVLGVLVLLLPKGSWPMLSCP